MNRIRVLSILFALIFCTQSAYSQLNNVENLLRGGVDDANFLLKEYLTPFGKGFGANLNNGWFTTASTHKFLGIDLTVTANLAVAPPEDETFDLSALPLNSVRVTNSSGPSTSPTIIGEDSPGPDVTLFAKDPTTGAEIEIGKFLMPEGIGFNYVGSPMIQAGVGIGGNTDVLLRFFPESQLSEEIGSLQLLGFGVKHIFTGENRWGERPSVDISVLAGYTIFQVQSKDLALEPDPSAIQTGASYDDQQIELEANSFTVNLIISKSFSPLTLFGSVGYETSAVDLKLKGLFPVTAIEDNIFSPNFGQKAIRDLKDPINFSIDGANSLRANLGFRVKLLFLALHGSYTFANYPVATLGAGFELR